MKRERIEAILAMVSGRQSHPGVALSDDEAEALCRMALASLQYVPDIEKSREIFREAFAHISMHMNPDGAHLFMPRNEWFDHASVQDAIEEERRLIAPAISPRSK